MKGQGQIMVEATAPVWLVATEQPQPLHGTHSCILLRVD